MTPRGGNARQRRSAQRAADRQQEGVNEALTLTAAGETLAIPDSADYRPATGSSSCGNCSHFSDGNCDLYDAAVDPDYTCDSWEAASTAAASDDDNFAAIMAFADQTCADCGHAAMSHDDGMGACAIQGCDCAKMAEASDDDTETAALTAAAGDIVWAPEEGVLDLMGDVTNALNPPDSWRWWTADVSLDLTKVLLCDGDMGEWWVAPITVDATSKEPTLGPKDEWVAVEQGWVESDDEYSERLAAFIQESERRGIKLAPHFVSVSKSAGTTMRMMLRDLEFAPLDLPAVAPGGEANVTPPLETSGALKWVATLCPEGVPTDDLRIFAPGSIEWRELPLSLMAMLETQEGHDGATVAGRIDNIWREEATGLIRGSGEFDVGDFGAEVARLVGDETLRGISVDIAVSEMEIAYRSQVLDEEGRWVKDSDSSEGLDMMDVLFGDGDEPVLYVVRKGIIGAATVCPFQAFREATIEMASSLVAATQSQMIWTVTSQAGFTVTEARRSDGEPTEAVSPAEGSDDALTASAALTAAAAGLVPEVPPREWFDDPELDGPTGLTMTDDGRIYGHAAMWDTCHIGIPGVCTTAPESHSDYAYFHLKEVLCDDGSRISCGTITVDAPHADQPASRAAATAHYDHTGTATADVVVGEDDHGIWVAGALRPDADAAAARKLRGATLSGDWRDVNGNLELVALLAVNVPGFPVPRTRALVASADDGPQVVTLIAAGVYDSNAPHKSMPIISNVEAEQFKALADMEAFAEIGDEVPREK